MEQSQLILPALIALVLTLAGTPLLIPVLRRIRAGQSIREDGPSSHLVKSGTPTMGGIVLIGTVVIASLVTIGPDKELIIVLAVFVAFGFLGFLDDFVKVARRRSLGLTVGQKLLIQIVIAAGLALYHVSASDSGTMIAIPFLGRALDFGWFAVPFLIFVVVAMANSVNLTDGLDGLAAGVTFFVAAFFAAVAVALSVLPAGVYSIALAGACLGFLFYNRHPARIFMGDTGSMALGGGLAAVAIIMEVELLLPVVGAVYVAEALSVLLQVLYFKKTNGKRLFRMAPLHHHFELSGWKESKVVAVFWIATVVFCGLGWLALAK
ncbi:MAG: phospho-N-acetylmuramoyl-pentapeptide-transferase [Firmicutes bacterium HGW-Firmicutes-11]|jgi:phospho-N-acetylmuramoyl-pentapeptide-transferase|nr:MAG: phospho-N-acetylmuramoyl-pentapeptide-transferase [Firmicutes bacterium HGW-Firmicutes-11]